LTLQIFYATIQWESQVNRAPEVIDTINLRAVKLVLRICYYFGTLFASQTMCQK